MKLPTFRDATTGILDGELILYGKPELAESQLRQLWKLASGPVQCPAAPASIQVRHQPAGEGLVRADSTKRSQEPTPATPVDVQKWLIGFAKSFLKAVDSIDRKLQGRILQALTDIATAPLAERGDTVKPLSGDMNGFWRYRIGDFRLVYYPDAATHTITVCDFDSRGGVYD